MAGPALPPGSAATSREVTEDLLYLGFQARFLEAGVLELVRSEGLDPAFAGFSVDVRSTVIARAMRYAADGKGDVCHPGPLSPGPSLAFGGTPLEFLRHLSRRGTSPAAARIGGSSWTDLRRGLIGWGGSLGTMTQVLAGAALAFKRRGEDRVALVFEEHKALDTGAWHEGMNLAAALRAPVIVVLDAPGPGDARDSRSIQAIATSHGVVAANVSEEPCSRLFHLVAAARRRAVDGGGPTLIALAARTRPDPWGLHDDLAAWALAEGGLSAQDLEAITKAAAAGVEHAVDRLGKEPGPDPLDALAPVRTGAEPRQPWTRRELRGSDRRARVAARGGSHVH